MKNEFFKCFAYMYKNKKRVFEAFFVFEKKKTVLKRKDEKRFENVCFIL